MLDTCFTQGTLNTNITRQESMIDWGPDNWCADIDWTQIEQQSAKRHKSHDTRCPDASAAVQVLVLPRYAERLLVP